MSRNVEQDPEVTLCDACRTIPLSVLTLDHPEPIGGWEAMLRGRGVELLEDDLGRVSIRREDARALIEERREHDRRRTEEAARRQEEMARKVPPTPGGIRFPENGDPAMSAFEVMRHVEADAEQSDPNRRVSPHEEFLMQRLGRPRKVEVKEAEK